MAFVFPLSFEKVVVENFRDNFPVAVQLDESDEVSEEFFADGTMQSCGCRGWPRKTDRFNLITTWFTSASRRGPCVDDGEILPHRPVEQVAISHTDILGLRMKHAGQTLCIAEVEAVKIFGKDIHYFLISLFHGVRSSVAVKLGLQLALQRALTAWLRHDRQRIST